MCLAIPAKICRLLDEQQAIVDVGGIEKHISIALIDAPLVIGDYVIVHVGYALSRLDEQEAKRTLQLMQAMSELE
jgi:hydrogenase expression/formation protein HypC